MPRHRAACRSRDSRRRLASMQLVDRRARPPGWADRVGGCGTIRSAIATTVANSSACEEPRLDANRQACASITSRVLSFQDGATRLAQHVVAGIAVASDRVMHRDDPSSSPSAARPASASPAKLGGAGQRRTIQDVLAPVAPAAHVARDAIGVKADAGEAHRGEQPHPPARERDACGRGGRGCDIGQAAPRRSAASVTGNSMNGL